MDPDEALKQIRELCKMISKSHSTKRIAALGEMLAEWTEALDGWLSKGGFPPKAWAKR